MLEVPVTVLMPAWTVLSHRHIVSTVAWKLYTSVVSESVNSVLVMPAILVTVYTQDEGLISEVDVVTGWLVVVPLVWLVAEVVETTLVRRVVLLADVVLPVLPGELPAVDVVAFPGSETYSVGLA